EVLVHSLRYVGSLRESRGISPVYRSKVNAESSLLQTDYHLRLYVHPRQRHDESERARLEHTETFLPDFDRRDGLIPILPHERYPVWRVSDHKVYRLRLHLRYDIQTITSDYL